MPPDMPPDTFLAQVRILQPTENFGMDAVGRLWTKLHQSPTKRTRQLLEWVNGGHLPRNEASARGLQRRLVLVGPRRPNAFDQLDAHLPASRPEAAYVVSPFFDQAPRTEGPEKRLWIMLRKRGDAELQLHVAGEYAPEIGKWRLKVPAHVLRSTPTGRGGVRLSLHPLPVTDIGARRGVPVPRRFRTQGAHVPVAMIWEG